MVNLDDIIDLIEKNKLKKALTKLKSFLKDLDEDLYHSTILQLSSLKRCEDDRNNFELSGVEAIKMKTQITKATLAIYAEALKLREQII